MHRVIFIHSFMLLEIQAVSILSRFLVYSSCMKILLIKKEKPPRCNVHSTQVKSGNVAASFSTVKPLQ